MQSCVLRQVGWSQLEWPLSGTGQSQSLFTKIQCSSLRTSQPDPCSPYSEAPACPACQCPLDGSTNIPCIGRSSQLCPGCGGAASSVPLSQSLVKGLNRIPALVPGLQVGFVLLTQMLWAQHCSHFQSTSLSVFQPVLHECPWLLWKTELKSLLDIG